MSTATTTPRPKPSATPEPGRGQPAGPHRGNGQPTTPAAALRPARRYAEQAPRRAPANVVVCTWTAVLPTDLPPLRIVPDACVDLISDGQRAWVAGPDTGPVIEHVRAGATLVGLRLRPGAAATVLGVPAAALRDLRVDLEALWGAEGDRIVAALQEASQDPPLQPTRADAARARAATARDAGADDGHARATAATAAAAAAVLEDVVAARLAVAGPPDPAAAAVVGRLAAAPPGATPSVAALARDLGYSERQLLRRCTEAIGYGPAVLVRVLRFQRFLAAAGRSPQRPLAALAADAGYADQAHLAHEARRLAGVPPSALLPPPGNVSDPDKTRRPPVRHRAGP